MDADRLPSNMTAYDRLAWAEIERWRANRLDVRTRRRLPQGTRDRLGRFKQKARDNLAALSGTTSFESVFVQSFEGLLGVASHVATSTVPKGAVREAYRQHGQPVDDLSDIQKLDLAIIDKVKPRLGFRYTAAATIQGSATGFVISGGELLATAGSVAGGGAGAAPGAATVIGAMAADAAAVVLASNRAVAHIGAYYGYDAERPDERLLALSIIGFGTATNAGKVAAYHEISKLVQDLARRKTWQQLNESVVTKVVQQIFTRLGFRLTQRKLGQAVPVIGGVIGGGMNAQLLQRISDDAEHVYRERFLRERYGLPNEATAEGAPDAVQDLHIIDVLDAEIETEGDGGSTGHTDEDKGPGD